MSNSTGLVYHDNEREMFADLPPMDPLDVKKDELATHLTALMVHSKATRTAMAEKLGWKKSLVTRLLSGKSNPTIKTIFQFSNALGYDFHLVFGRHDEKRPRQPWEGSRSIAEDTPQPNVQHSPVITIVVKSQKEVAEEIASGNGQRYYVSSIRSIDDGTSSAANLGNIKVAIPSASPWISSSEKNILDEHSFSYSPPMYTP